MKKVYFLLTVLLSLNLFADESQTAKTFEIDRDGIRKTFFENLPQILECEKQVKNNPDLNGDVVFDFDVNDKGKAFRVDISQEKSTLVDKTLTDCLMGKVKTWAFPPTPKGRTLQVFYPI